VVVHRWDAASEDDEAFVDDDVDDAYVDDDANEDDAKVAVVPYRMHRPSSVQNAYVVVDDQVVDREEDPYCAFWRNVLVANDEDVVASDRKIENVAVVVVWRDEMDRPDDEASCRVDRVKDADASFCTYVDEVEVDYHRDHDED
jgi:hypothetical protein